MRISLPLARLLLLIEDSKAGDGDGGGKHELQVDVPLPHEVWDLPRINIVRAVLVVLKIGCM